MVSSENYANIFLAVGIVWVVLTLTWQRFGMLPWFVLAGFVVIIYLLSEQREQLEKMGKRAPTAPAAQPQQHMGWPEFVNELEHY